MKGYGKERHQSHKNSIGRKQTNCEVVGRPIVYSPSHREQVVYQQFATKPRNACASGRNLDVDVRSLIVQARKNRIEIEAEKLLKISSNQ